MSESTIHHIVTHCLCHHPSMMCGNYASKESALMWPLIMLKRLVQNTMMQFYAHTFYITLDSYRYVPQILCCML